MTTEQQVQVKSMVREQWANAAEAWRSGHDTLAEMSKHVTLALVEAADLAPGHHVLDLAGGTGEPSLTVARRVAPGGSVVCTDLVEPMLAAAEANAKRLGISNMTFETADMEQLQFEDGRFDRVTSRFGIMFPPDTSKALGEIRRVLKPGGRAAFAVWAAASENPNFTAINEPLAARGLLEPPPPGVPTPFTFAEPGSLSAKLREAGFSTVEEETRDVEWVFPGTAEEHLAFMKATLPNIRKAVEAAPPEALAEAIASMNRYRDGDRLHYGARVHIAYAIK